MIPSDPDYCGYPIRTFHNKIISTCGLCYPSLGPDGKLPAVARNILLRLFTSFQHQTMVPGAKGHSGEEQGLQENLVIRGALSHHAYFRK